MTEAVPHSSSSQSKKRAFLRLFLIRHGETESNVQKIVIGQSDSPLTAKGIEQTRVLGERLGERNKKDHLSSFWRIYSSDLQRAQHTTQLLLDELLLKQKPIAGEPMVRLETRLRELGRGAREDLPKILSEMQAFSERERLGNMDPIPLFETPQDGWKRVADWLDEVMEDAVQECLDDEDASNSSDKVLDVLVISHSGLLRLFLERLVGVPRLQEHPEGRFEEKNGVLVFSIPNSSVTILNIDLSKLKEPSEEKHSSWTVSDAVQVRIEQLTNTEHYSRMQESTAVAEAPQQ